MLDLKRVSAVVLLWLSLASSAGQAPVQTVPGKPALHANGHSAPAAISSDGALVLFSSTAANLTTNPIVPGTINAFLRNVADNTTELISISTNGTGGNGISTAVGLSAGRKKVLLQSDAGNLVANDSNEINDIFLFDTESKTMEWASRQLSNMPPTFKQAGYGSANPVMSADGNFVAFDSLSPLTGIDPAGNLQIFLRDVASSRTLLVSTGRTTKAGSGGNSRFPSISADGSRVVYESTASNLTPGDSNGRSDIFLFSNLTNQLLSIANNGLAANGDSSRPVISNDGRWVAFTSSAQNLATGFVAAPGVEGLFVRDLQEAKTHWVRIPPKGTPSGYHFSADSRYLFHNTSNRIYRWNMASRDGSIVSITNVEALAWSVSSNGEKLALTMNVSALEPSRTNSTLQLWIKDLVNDSQILASRNFAGDTAARGDILDPIMSGDGDAVVFSSGDSDLTRDDSNASHDTFVYSNGAVKLVSGAAVAASEIQACLLRLNSITGDGKRLFFTTDLALDSNDTNNLPDLYYYENGATYFASLFPEAPISAPGFRETAITPDGRHAAFATTAGFPGNEKRTNNIYLKDLLTGATKLASVGSDNINPGNGSSTLPLISDDARFIAFESTARNLVPEDGSVDRDIFVRDMLLNRTQLASKGAGTRRLRAMSGNGAVVAMHNDTTLTLSLFFTHTGEVKILGSTKAGQLIFSRDGSKLVATDGSSITLFETFAATPVPQLVCTNCWEPFLTSNGSYLVFQDSSRELQLFDLDLRFKIRNLTGGTGGNFSNGRVSEDGRRAVFSQAGARLADTGPKWNRVFIRDGSAEPLMLSGAMDQAEPDHYSTAALLSADGARAAFISTASNLQAGDYNNKPDIFVADLPGAGADSEPDGLPDDWEMSMIGSLAESAQDDHDMDGVTNGEEFKAGTNPADNSSVLAFTRFESVLAGNTILQWSSVVGKTYIVVGTADAAAPYWERVAAPVKADGETSQVSIPTSGQFRFFRVLARED